MPAVLAQVKHALGTDAVILHTRAFKRGGFLGFGAKTLVEVTAARGSEIGRSQSQQRQRAASNASRNVSAISPPARRERQTDAQPMLAGDLIRRTYLAAQAEMKQSAGVAAPQRGQSVQYGGASRESSTSGATAVMTPPAQMMDLAAIARSSSATAAPSRRSSSRPRESASIELADEMRVVKRMVAKMARQQREQSATKGRGKSAPSTPDMPNKLYDQYVSLLQQEVTDELAEEVVQQVRSSLGADDMENDEKIKKAVLQAISKLIPIDETPANQPRAKDGRPLTIALIGPTGVGKTTTIAKLAANFKLREKKKVGLITIDTYRIAAVDQLRTYANIIGVPLHVISNPADMGDALTKCANCDVILIDTAGRSQRDDPKLEQLNDYIIAADPHEVHLVLSSTCAQAAIFDVIDRFSQIRVDRIIFTKLDEAVTFGVLFNVARKVNKRLSYLTTGQEVPHQIEVGRSDRLASLVLGEGL